jgi:hypothetical protein
VTTDNIEIQEKILGILAAAAAALVCAMIDCLGLV